MAEEPQQTHSVLVLDMAHSHDPDGERTIKGFATVADARRYAEARVRSSVEELRGENTGPDELRARWHLYGEDCIVIGDSYRGAAELDLYIAIPADPAELDWAAMTPRLRRYHALLIFTDSEDRSVWVGGVFYRYTRPTLLTMKALLRQEAANAFARKGHPDAVPVSVHVVKLHELFDPPEPPIGRPLLNWRVDLEFVCHDIKYGSREHGVFLWPEQPSGDALDRMARVLIGDGISVRGDNPENADYSEVLQIKVEATDQEPDYPLWQVETTTPLEPTS